MQPILINSTCWEGDDLDSRWAAAAGPLAPGVRITSYPGHPQSQCFARWFHSRINGCPGLGSGSVQASWAAHNAIVQQDQRDYQDLEILTVASRRKP